MITFKFDIPLSKKVIASCGISNEVKDGLECLFQKLYVPLAFYDKQERLEAETDDTVSIYPSPKQLVEASSKDNTLLRCLYNAMNSGKELN